MPTVRSVLPGLSALHEQGLAGSGVGVGLLDSDLDLRHPALMRQDITHRYFDDNGIVLSGELPGDKARHGTHNAGLICGAPVEGKAIGVAPECSLYAGTVLNEGNNLVRVLRGLEWMTTLDVKVVCLPLGVVGAVPVFRQAIAKLTRQGKLVVASIGNSRQRFPHSPALYPEVLAVGAAGPVGKTRFSARGKGESGDAIKPEVLAPGIELTSAAAGGGLRSSSGTSQAAAVVAGLAALLWEGAPKATAAEISRALCASAQPTDDTAIDHSRFGLVHAAQAADWLQTPESLPVFTPQTIAEFPDRWFEPGLEELVSSSTSDELLTILVTAKPNLPSEHPDGAVGRLVAQLENTRYVQPHSVNWMPQAHAAVITASPTYVQHLWSLDDVVTISTCRMWND